MRKFYKRYVYWQERAQESFKVELKVNEDADSCLPTGLRSEVPAANNRVGSWDTASGTDTTI